MSKSIKSMLFRSSAALVPCLLAVALGGCEQPSALSLTDAQTPATGGLAQLQPPGSTTSGVAEIVGNVVDATNISPLSGATVQLMDASGNPLQSTMTNGDGKYAFSPLSAGTYTLSFSDSGYSTYTPASPYGLQDHQSLTVDAALSPALAAGELRIVVSWNAAPQGWGMTMSDAAKAAYQDTVMDVDAYLMVPGSANPIAWYNRSGNGAALDHDTKNWSGPETITISTQLSGTYTYYVANYSDPCNSAALGNSGVSVSVYDETGRIGQYSISGGSGFVYEFFTVTHGVISPVNQYNDSLIHSKPDMAKNGCSQLINDLI